MKKTLLATIALTLFASASAYATSFRQSITCSDGKGDAVMNITYHMFNGINVETYLTNFDFPKNSITMKEDGMIEAFVSELNRYAEGEQIIDKNVKLRMKFIDSTKAGKLLLLEELSTEDRKSTSADIRVLKCK